MKNFINNRFFTQQIFYFFSISPCFCFFTLDVYSFFFLFLVCSFFFFKEYKKKRDSITNNDNDGSKIFIFFNDFKIIEDHLKTEFKFFYFLKFYNIILMFICLILFNLYYDLLFESLLLSSLVSLVIFYGLNLIVYNIIILVIVWFCNPTTSLKYVVTTGSLVTIAVSGVGLVALGVNANVTGVAFGDPIPLKQAYDYQKAIKGYAYRTQEEGIAALHHNLLTGKKPPVDSNGFVDLTETNRALGISHKENIRLGTREAIFAVFNKDKK